MPHLFAYFWGLSIRKSPGSHVSKWFGDILPYFRERKLGWVGRSKFNQTLHMDSALMFLFLSRPSGSGGEEVLLLAASFRVYLKSINHPFAPACSSTSACRLWLMLIEHLMPRIARPVKPLHPLPTFPPKWDSRCVPMATGLSDGPHILFFCIFLPVTKKLLLVMALTTHKYLQCFFSTLCFIFVWQTNLILD